MGRGIQLAHFLFFGVQSGRQNHRAFAFCFIRRGVDCDGMEVHGALKAQEDQHHAKKFAVGTQFPDCRGSE